MRITHASARVEAVPLTRPYTIAFRSVSAVEIVVVTLRDEAGRIGLGAASPEPHVTGETNEACQAALAQPALDELRGTDVRALASASRRIASTREKTPAAAAALDMALHDLWAQHLGLPLCDALGRCHEALPTSITLGIRTTAESLAEADEYLGRGFTVLKVKIGRDLDADLERLTRLRERVGRDIVLRADANQGYDLAETRRFFAATAHLGIEFLEQPVLAGATDELRALPEGERRRIAVDEPLLAPETALRLATPPWPGGIFNIKLMKCGGVGPALRIATVAELAGLQLMWGCMDESRISIAAALHAALASPATRYLDLDGSLDLARDVAEGGFTLEGGRLRPTDAPGLGVRPI